MFRIMVLVFLISIFSLIAHEQKVVVLKPHERWWAVNVDKRMSDFEKWLGDVNAISRVAMRKYIRGMNYKSILDIPCGLCTEFEGYQQDRDSIIYFGVDITPQLVMRAHKRGINVKQGSIEAIPFSDSSIDVCYARHILEHLDYYKKAIAELIRVAAKEVIIIFFMKPCDGHTDVISTNILERGEQLLYHNCYSKEKLECYVKEQEKVADIVWKDLGDEQVLHIYLK